MARVKRDASCVNRTSGGVRGRTAEARGGFEKFVRMSCCSVGDVCSSQQGVSAATTYRLEHLRSLQRVERLLGEEELKRGEEDCKSRTEDFE